MVDMLKGCVKVKTEVRREQITQAALNIIANHGVKRLTISAIAKHLGISGANLYRHFKNKNEILCSVVDKIGEGLLQNLKMVQCTTSSNPLPKLKKLFELHLEYLENNKGIPRLVFSEEMHITNAKLREKLLDAINSYTKGIALLIREGQKNGTINKGMDSQILALTIVGMIQIAVMKWSLNSFSFSLADLGMRFWKNFERCITAK
jgi:TetR/AcrR family fatty acid metabolism transcriptional regulator